MKLENYTIRKISLKWGTKKKTFSFIRAHQAFTETLRTKIHFLTWSWLNNLTYLSTGFGELVKHKELFRKSMFFSHLQQLRKKRSPYRNSILGVVLSVPYPLTLHWLPALKGFLHDVLRAAICSDQTKSMSLWARQNCRLVSNFWTAALLKNNKHFLISHGFVCWYHCKMLIWTIMFSRRWRD